MEWEELKSPDRKQRTRRSRLRGYLAIAKSRENQKTPQCLLGLPKDPVISPRFDSEDPERRRSITPYKSDPKPRHRLREIGKQIIKAIEADRALDSDSSPIVIRCFHFHGV